jgi:hypothetical protein
LARCAPQALELQSRLTYLYDRIWLEHDPLMGRNWHAVDTRAIGAPLIGDVESGLF